MRLRSVFILTLSLVLVSGCTFIGFLEELGCGFLSGKNADHCYQDAAVRKSDSDTCGKIKAEDFNSVQGPAPRDRCYVRVAEKSGDGSGCENIEGGMISYSKAECYQRAAKTANDPALCEKIGSAERGFSKEACLAQFGEKTQTEGTCRFDTDCQPKCEGNTLWKRGCDAQTNTCKNTFDDDCSSQSDSAAVYTFSRVCQGGECVKDTSAMQSKKQEISEQVKKWTAGRQDVTALMLDENKLCLSALSEVTNKFIADSAVKLGMLPSSIWDVASDATNNLLDLAADSGKMSAEEFISYHCNLYKALQTDLDVLEKRISKAQEEYKEVDLAMKSS